MSPLDSLKWLAGLALALLLFFGGRSCGVDSGSKQLADCRGAHAAAVNSGARMAEALEATTKQTALAEIASQEQAKRAEVAVRQAGEAREQYAASLDAIESAMAAGMRDPDCAAQLRAKTCIALH